MGFWSKLRAALNITAKAAEATAPMLGNEKTSKIVGTVGAVVEAVTEEQPKEGSEKQ